MGVGEKELKRREKERKGEEMKKEEGQPESSKAGTPGFFLGTFPNKTSWREE